MSDITRRNSVKAAYSAIAEDPDREAPFPNGRALAEGLGYPPELLNSLPAVAVDGFCGVSCPSLYAEIASGVSVLDLGCGAGLDTIIAARRTGPGGHVVGVDFSPAMLRRAGQALAEAKLTNVELKLGDAEQIPLRDGTVDVALVNGIFNLNPARNQIFTELARVVRMGGTVFAAELVLREPLAESDLQDETNWFT